MRHIVGGIVIVVVLALVYVIAVRIQPSNESRRWQRAVDSAKWQPVSRDTPNGTDVYLELVARTSDRREVLAEQFFEAVPHGLDDAAWTAAHAEIWGRAEHRATVRNTEARR